MGFGDGKYSGIPADLPKPVVAHEMGYFVTLPDLSQIELFKGRLRPYWLCQTRDLAASRGVANLYPEWMERSYRLQAVCLKTNIEAARRSRLGGYSVWLFQDYPNCAEGVVDMFFRPKALSAAEFRRFNAPTVLLLEAPRRSLRFGERASMMLLVSAVLEDGKARVENEWNVRAFPAQRPSGLPRRVKFDEPYRRYAPTPAAEGGDSRPSDGDLWVAGRADSAIVDFLEQGGRVLLMDPEPLFGVEKTNYRLYSVRTAYPLRGRPRICPGRIDTARFPQEPRQEMSTIIAAILAALPPTSQPDRELASEVRDKGWIVYGARSPKGDWDLFMMRPNGSGSRNLTNTPAWNEGLPRLSPDGKRLLYRRIPAAASFDNNRHGAQGELVLAGADASSPAAFGKEGECPWAFWSPYGSRIACLSPKGVTIVDISSKRTLATLDRKGFFQQLVWSPDGRWFAGVANDFGTGWSVARMDAAGGTPRGFLHGGHDRQVLPGEGDALLGDLRRPSAVKGWSSAPTCSSSTPSPWRCTSITPRRARCGCRS